MVNSPKKIRTIFMGTPEFAVPSLLALADSEQIDIAAVITQPDMPAGRNLALKGPAVKTAAARLGLPIFQPRSLTLFADTPEGTELFHSGIDLIAVAAYAQILPKKILELPRLGCLNVHASLLPKYRGAGVIQAPILNGDQETGVTIIRMDASLDTGPILSQNKFGLDGTETAGSLSAKLSEAGGQLLIATINAYNEGRIDENPQDDSLASYVRTIKKQDGHIDWNRPARMIERQIRAMNPWPGACAFLRNPVSGEAMMFKILKTAKDPIDMLGKKFGDIFDVQGGLAVMCADQALLIERLQVSGKKETDSASYIRGNKDIIGKSFKN